MSELKNEIFCILIIDSKTPDIRPTAANLFRPDPISYTCGGIFGMGWDAPSGQTIGWYLGGDSSSDSASSTSISSYDRLNKSRSVLKAWNLEFACFRCVKPTKPSTERTRAATILSLRMNSRLYSSLVSSTTRFMVMTIIFIWKPRWTPIVLAFVGEICLTGASFRSVSAMLLLRLVGRRVGLILLGEVLRSFITSCRILLLRYRPIFKGISSILSSECLSLVLPVLIRAW